MKKVIVTGASGLIGRASLQPLLNYGLEVHAVSSKDPNFYLGLSKNECVWHQVNVLDLEKIKGSIKTVSPTHLLHLAWYGQKNRLVSEENFRWTQATIELLKQFKNHGGQRVVIAGSCAEYDWNYGYCSEYLTPRKPSTHYGVCKNALQEMLRSYSSTTGLSSAWGRVFFCYGPYEHQDRLVSSIICSLLQKKQALCSHGNQIRDFLYVQDVANALVSLLVSNVTGPVNIGSGQPIAVREIIDKIGIKIGRADLIKLGAIESSQNEYPFLIANIERLSNEVGWSRIYSLEEGLDLTIKHWKDVLNNQ